MVHCHDETASSFVSKFGAKSPNIFMLSPYNVTVVCGIYCLPCQDEIFLNNPLDVKEHDEHALGFAFPSVWCTCFIPRTLV
jgi:hypothetical protein